MDGHGGTAGGDRVGVDAGTAIRALCEDWALARDTGQWARLAACWHEDGWMTTTWFDGPASDFVTASRAGWDAGAQVTHTLGGTSCEVVGDRAVAETRVRIELRADLEGVLVDVACTARFCDLLERRDRWAIVRRQPVYERDRVDAVAPAVLPPLDAARLASLPTGYRHLGYVQEATGQRVLRGLPGLRGPAADALRAQMTAWLRREQS